MPKRTHDGLKKRCDCPKKSWPKCSHPWWFNFHHGDREHRYSLDKIARARNQPLPTTKSDAITWRDQLRAEIRSGTFVAPDAPVVPATIADAPLTFSEVADRYLTTYVGRRQTDIGDVQWTGRFLRPRTAEQAAYHLAVLRRTEVQAPGGSLVRLE